MTIQLRVVNNDPFLRHSIFVIDRNMIRFLKFGLSFKYFDLDECKPISFIGMIQ